MSLFSSLQNAMPGRSRERRENGDFSVTDRLQISNILQRAYKSHSLLNATIPGHAGRFTSAILGIYDEHGFLVLDELTPEDGHHLLLQQGSIGLSGRVHGVALGFSSRLIESRRKNGIAYYKMAMPKHMEYRQRRNDHRISARGIQITFHGLRGKGNHQILKGYVNDMSRKGIGLVLENDVSLYPGEVLSSCIISIPGAGEIPFSLEVRFSMVLNQGPVTRCGGRFQDIDSKSLHSIRNCINRLERSHARNVQGRR